MEALADMMDRALRPEDGGNSEAGKDTFRQITAAARAQMEQVKQAKREGFTPLACPSSPGVSDIKETTRKGPINDNQ